MLKIKLFHLIPLLLLINNSNIHAQNKETDSLHLVFDEVVISANKFSEKSKFISQKVISLSSETLKQSMASNTIGILEETGKVMVQKSQLGGGSPVIRGFEASRILLVLDGVRMNNAIYRTGHLQNIVTIDDDILDKIEILNGPASALHGSDALGGVIVLNTKSPKLSQSDQPLLKVGSSLSYFSAVNGFSAHASVNAGLKRFASLTAFTFSQYGDLRQGNDRNQAYPEFGKRHQYITQINGKDTILNQSRYNVQKYSGYHQIDLMQKFLFQAKANQSHELNLQYSTSSDIPRYDRLTDVRNGKLRWAEWYYGPQQRFLAAYQFKKNNLSGFFDQLMFGLNYQKIQESRMQRAYRKDVLQNRIEDIQVLGYHIDLRKSKGRHEINIGTDGQYNNLKSTAFNENVHQETKTYDLDSRYPDGSNNMSYVGVYTQHLYKIIPEKLIFNDGLRLNYVSLNSTFKDTSILHLPFTDAHQKNLSFSFNAGLVYLPDASTKISGNISSGFRAPNIDDLAKVFESAGGEQLVVPNATLKPEKTYNFDLNLSKLFADQFLIELSGFYTLFRDAIVLDRFQIDGKDSVQYDGKMTPVVASQNKAKAYLYGYQAYLSYKPAKDLLFYSNLTYTYGRYIDSEGMQLSLDHVPPLFGKTGVKYHYKNLSFELNAQYHGWKRVKDYNPFGEDNLQYATPEGMPAWWTLNFKTNWQISKPFSAQLGVENILDKNYRVFASGISNPGINVVAKIKYNL